MKKIFKCLLIFISMICFSCFFSACTGLKATSILPPPSTQPTEQANTEGANNDDGTNNNIDNNDISDSDVNNGNNTENNDDNTVEENLTIADADTAINALGNNFTAELTLVIPQEFATILSTLFELEIPTSLSGLTLKCAGEVVMFSANIEDTFEGEIYIVDGNVYMREKENSEWSNFDAEQPAFAQFVPFEDVSLEEFSVIALIEKLQSLGVEVDVTATSSTLTINIHLAEIISEIQDAIKTVLDEGATEEDFIERLLAVLNNSQDEDPTNTNESENNDENSNNSNNNNENNSFGDNFTDDNLVDDDLPDTSWDEYMSQYDNVTSGEINLGDGDNDGTWPDNWSDDKDWNDDDWETNETPNYQADPFNNENGTSWNDVWGDDWDPYWRDKEQNDSNNNIDNGDIEWYPDNSDETNSSNNNANTDPYQYDEEDWFSDETNNSSDRNSEELDIVVGEDIDWYDESIDVEDIWDYDEDSNDANSDTDLVDVTEWYNEGIANFDPAWLDKADNYFSDPGSGKKSIGEIGEIEDYDNIGSFNDWINNNSNNSKGFNDNEIGIELDDDFWRDDTTDEMFIEDVYWGLDNSQNDKDLAWVDGEDNLIDWNDIWEEDDKDENNTNDNVEYDIIEWYPDERYDDVQDDIFGDDGDNEFDDDFIVTDDPWKQDNYNGSEGVFEDFFDDPWWRDGKDNSYDLGNESNDNNTNDDNFEWYPEDENNNQNSGSNNEQSGDEEEISILQLLEKFANLDIRKFDIKIDIVLTDGSLASVEVGLEVEVNSASETETAKFDVSAEIVFSNVGTTTIDTTDIDEFIGGNEDNTNQENQNSQQNSGNNFVPSAEYDNIWY